MSQSDDEAAELAKINERMQELASSHEHYVDAIRERVPGITETLAFQGWVIQELAGMQIAIETLAKELRKPRT